jgi:hypothetical protein
VDARTALHGFADIVAYSRRNPHQQVECQERLVKIINASLTDAGVRPDCMDVGRQGDACMLTFPSGDLDVSRVLAVMPRHFNGDLKAYNRDVAAHARLRVRLSFAMGPTAEGLIGRAGNVPITVSRLNNATSLRAAMAANPDAYLGVIIEDELYRKYVAQEFRTDLDVDEYAKAHVSDEGKGFHEDAWIRLVGYAATAPPGQASTGDAEGHPSTFPSSAVAPKPPGDDSAAAPGTLGAPNERADKARAQRRRRLTTAWATVIGAAITTGGIPLGIYLSSGSANATQPKTAASQPAARTTAASHPKGRATTASTASASPTSSPATTSPTVNTPNVSESNVATTNPSPSTSGTTTARAAPPAVLVAEYSDWAYGIKVYANNHAASSNDRVIPFNQQVEVSCVASNDSGIASINAFYLIASGVWKGTYASANEFSNGGPPGSASDPDIDPRVHACPGS